MSAPLSLSVINWWVRLNKVACFRFFVFPSLRQKTKFFLHGTNSEPQSLSGAGKSKKEFGFAGKEGTCWFPFQLWAYVLASPDLSISSSMWLWPWTKRLNEFFQPALGRLKFSCCSSSDLPWHSALRASPVESGSPVATSEPAGNEGLEVEEVFQGGTACCNDLALKDLQACDPASSWNPEEDRLFPGGS